MLFVVVIVVVAVVVVVLFLFTKSYVYDVISGEKEGRGVKIVFRKFVLQI